MRGEVFCRVEQKYLLTKEKYVKLMKLLSPKIKMNIFTNQTICNVYYDTRNFDLINHSIQKPIYKEKVRVRSYGVPTLKDHVFIELKKKYQGVVSKRRAKMYLNVFYEGVHHYKFKHKNKQIIDEIDFCFNRYSLIPTYYIAYDRESYYAKEDNELRITFDRNLRYRDYDLELEKGDYGKKYFDEDIYIMEIKTLSSLPLWFVSILSHFKIYPCSFSKYGNIYMKEKRN